MTGLVRNLAGDALDLELGLGGVGCEGVFEGEEEVLPLADIGDPVHAHAAERSGDGLALGIEDGALQCDIDMGFHGSDYKLAAGRMEWRRGGWSGERRERARAGMDSAAHARRRGGAVERGVKRKGRHWRSKGPPLGAALCFG